MTALRAPAPRQLARRLDREAYLDCSTGWGDALTLFELYVERGVRC